MQALNLSMIIKAIVINNVIKAIENPVGRLND